MTATDPAPWESGDEPLCSLPGPFVLAVDTYLECEAEANRAEMLYRAARRRAADALRNAEAFTPVDVDNGKVGYRFYDVFSWRRDVRAGKSPTGTAP